MAEGFFDWRMETCSNRYCCGDMVIFCFCSHDWSFEISEFLVMLWGVKGLYNEIIIMGLVMVSKVMCERMPNPVKSGLYGAMLDAHLELMNMKWPPTRSCDRVPADAVGEAHRDEPGMCVWNSFLK